MKAKFGAIVVAGSGKIGGHVASRNRSGAYFRTKVTPVNPNTPAQAQARGILSGFSQAWRGLTQSERDEWDAAVTDFAATDVFGDLRNPTGKNLYVKLNANLLSIGEAPIISPPSLAVVDLFTADTLAISIAALTWDLGITTTSALTSAQLWATTSVSAGKKFVKNLYRQIGVIPGASASPFDIKAAYIAKFGNPAIGEKVFVQVVPVVAATGQKGVGSQVSTIVVA